MSSFSFSSGSVSFSERAVPAVAGTLELLVDGGLEVDHGAAFGQDAPVGRVDDCAAAGGEHDAVQAGQPFDGLFLALPKPTLPFLLEDERNVDAGFSLDIGVAVMEREPE